MTGRILHQFQGQDQGQGQDHLLLQRAALPPFLVLALTLVLTLELVQDSAGNEFFEKTRKIHFSRIPPLRIPPLSGAESDLQLDDKIAYKPTFEPIPGLRHYSGWIRLVFLCRFMSSIRRFDLTIFVPEHGLGSGSELGSGLGTRTLEKMIMFRTRVRTRVRVRARTIERCGTAERCCSYG